MRSLIMICAGAALVAGCTTDGNVYAMPVGDVYAKLLNFRPQASGTGPFGRLNTNVTGSGGRQVVWSAEREPRRIRCTAHVRSGGAGADPDRPQLRRRRAEFRRGRGVETNMIRKRVIEMIDAKLSDRPYDPQRAQGSTAAFWPDDVIDHGDILDASAKAIEMDREARAAAAASGR